jgi:non-specific serine/threonine protein kinase
VQEARWLEVLEVEHDNLRAALTWAIGAGEAETAIRVAAALGWFWYLRGHLGEGRRWLDQVLALPRPPELRPHVARALRSAGKLAWEQADYARAAALLDEAAALSRSLGDEGGTARALLNLGVVAEKQGDDDQAAVRYAEALDHFRRLDDRPGMANALMDLADTAFRQGDLDRSAVLGDEALALSREIGDATLEALAWQNLGQLALARGDLEPAWTSYTTGLRLFVRLRNAWGIADAQGGWAGLAAATGEGERAARWLGTARAICAALGTPSVPHHAQYARSRATARLRLASAAFDAAFAAGTAVSPEEAAEEALAWSLPTDRPQATVRLSDPAAAFGLTEREREVLLLLATGRTNNEIAEALYISPRTAGTHVGRILEKLGVNSRAAAVAIAFQHGLA